MEELVTVYDDAGMPCGTAPRSRVRADNLRHAGTGIVVCNSAGQVYVHRRTDSKDVFPGLYDYAAGGVMAAGEEPLAAATRELEEELGVAGVPLEPIGVAGYEDEHTRYIAHLFTARWDGPVRWQPEEVAWGDWVDAAELIAWLDRSPEQFVPDSSSLLRGWIAEHLLAGEGASDD
ncbi:MAG: NUDIX domain-containing protein [Micrococcales bacterium]|nr:NUDIX domain-containing protein [Micrococcales bacterium]